MSGRVLLQHVHDDLLHHDRGRRHPLSDGLQGHDLRARAHDLRARDLRARGRDLHARDPRARGRRDRGRRDRGRRENVLGFRNSRLRSFLLEGQYTQL